MRAVARAQASDVMCSEVRTTSSTHSPRPKIELVRVSSSERAKIPINPVQLNLTYCHVRSATYVRPSTHAPSPLDVGPSHHHHFMPTNHQTRRPRWPWATWRTHTHSGPPVATKSCDDLHRVSVSIHHPRASSRSEGCLLTLLLTPSLLLPPRTNTPIHTTPKYRLWRGFSRSARDISLTTPSGPPRSAVSLAVMDKLTPKAQHHPVRHKASTLPYSQASGPQPVKSRHRGLLALLRRLSPRLKRTPSPERQWVKVEPRPGDRTSVASDHSFEAALQVRQAELLGYEVYTATLSAQDIPQKNDGNRGSRGGLSGLLTSLKNSKPSSKQEKHAASNGATEKKPQKDKEVTHQNSQKNSGVDNNEGHQNGAAPNPYTILRPQGPPPNVPATVVPALHLLPTEHLDSRPRPDMATATVPLHTSTRPTATAQRPHTLNLPNRGQSRAGWTAAAAGPPPHPQPLPPLPPALSYMTQPTQTTSVDSIGSCSLDVNATGTTSPATMEALDGSRRSLRSVSLENNLTGATSPGVSTGTTPLRPILKPQPYTDPGSIKDPGGTADASYKTPSYLGISCAVNGYSRLNRYDSALRDGYRSRDASPARLAFSRSRDSSPMRPEWKIFDLRIRASPQETAAKIKELKEELARFRAEYPHPQPERGRQNSSRKLGRKPSQGRSISVDRGYLSKSDSKDMMNGHSNGNQVGSDVRLVEINMSDPNKVKSSSYQYSFEQSVVRDGVCESSESIHCSSRTNGETPQKSFIQSRIERLYGPSALGAGFRSRRSLLELEKEQRDRQSAGYSSPSSLVDSHYDPEEKAPEGFPSVFRHLRPEFRTQLQVKRNLRLQPALPLDAPLDTDSPKRPGRVIPITLTDTIEKPQSPSPPVLLPKPQNLINNKSKIENGFREGNGHQVIVKKIVNGNGNIKELEIPVVKESYVNGGIEEKENNVRIPKENSHRTCSIVNGVSGTVHVNGDVTSSSKAEKDGHHFLKVVDSVIASIEADVASVEPDLETFRSEMNEEVRGKVLSAIGKARLLISQKIQQFQGLCHKNIAGSIGEEFPTTCEDLAGFWDMVYIQVEDIRHLFKEIKALKANGWKEVPQDDLVDNGEGNVSTGRARKKPAPRPFRASKTTKAAIEKTEESKARDEARKKIMEERRRAMKEAMKAKKAETEAKQGDADSVEIYAPDCK